MKYLRDLKGLTQKDVAGAVGISTLAVIRYEQYLYAELSPKLAKFYSEELDIPVSEVHAGYHAGRNSVRFSGSAALNPPPPLRIMPDEHPFVTFRKAISKRAVGKDSRMSFCILLAVHPATVALYESGKLPSMPSAIKEALTSLSDDYVNSLESLGAIWYERTK